MFTPASEVSGSTLNDGLALIAKVPPAVQFCCAVARVRDSNSVFVRLLNQTLVKLGVERDSFDQADGSGLSRHNMVRRCEIS
jgi:hypothetical protein